MAAWLSVVVMSSVCPSGVDWPPTGVGARSREPGLRGRLRRVVWLHFPKCGSSFGTTLLHYGCTGVPGDMPVIDSPRRIREDSRLFTRDALDSGWWAEHSMGHRPLPQPRAAPDCVAMLRDPRERMLSAFRADLHLSGAARAGWTRSEIQSRRRMNITEYASVVAGVMTKMIMGYHPYQRGVDAGKLAPAAAARLRSFAFVGLTHRWAESVCLFHRMWGGPMRPVELENLNPGVPKAAGEAHRVLQGFNDPDEAVFRAAQEKFSEQLRLYSSAATE
eukprot:TRINITY_DN7644_c0_g1_i1.p1 TRINITY_DN7644_c0_g1~~TRINITY_DN7644_c0_g1_i1.p1  ORF type:complete len:276 (+),score=66.89 TRINITY_DN7644_c0_g1_i1:71-898(+)